MDPISCPACGSGYVSKVGGFLVCESCGTRSVATPPASTPSVATPPVTAPGLGSIPGMPAEFTSGFTTGPGIANPSAYDTSLPGAVPPVAPIPGVPMDNMGHAIGLAPTRRLRTDRSLVLYLIFSFLTFGIYSLFAGYEWTEALNTAAQRDRRRTMNYILMLVLSFFTWGIFALIWFHMFSDRVGDESSRRGGGRMLSAVDFWLWGVLGSFIVIGPFIYLYKLMQALNFISGSYNQHGA